MNSKFTSWNWLGNAANMPSLRRRVFAVPSAPLYMELDRLFDSLCNGYFTPGQPAQSENQLSGAMIRPNLDISGDDKQYFVTVELPGVDQKDLHVEIENNTLSISGEKKYAYDAGASDAGEGDAAAGGTRSYYRIERSYGSFKRLLALPDDVDVDAVNANHKDGVLTITLPRRQVLPPEGKTIAINKK